MLEKLSSALKSGIDKLAGAVFVDKKLIDTIIRDLQRAMLEADINVYLVKEISEKIRLASINEKIKGIDKKEHIIKILHDEMQRILGQEKAELVLEKKEVQYVMLLGLYGAGKTTTISKLSSYSQKRGYKTAMLGLDVHRPAASEQLEQLAKQNSLQVFINKNEKSPEKIFKEYKKELEKFNIVFIDTAGRHALDKELVKEIKSLSNLIKPKYSILVIPADIGQAAKSQASEFQKALDINGVIITRMDSTAKGGGALTACNETKAKVLFITTGEKVNEIESFNPSNFISRILGMGDLETLLEKVKSAVDEKSAEETRKRLEEGKFTMLDLYEQLKSMENIGSLSKVASLIPGFGKAKIPSDLLDNQEEKMKKWKNVIDSMTPQEIETPELLEKQTSRIARIAKGSGTTTSNVRALLKQYKLIKDFASGDLSGLESGQLSQKQMQKLAKKFGKKIKI